MCAVFIGAFSVPAAAPPPNGLSITRSTNDVVLSFGTGAPWAYTVQTSVDLQQWSNLPPGVLGDGTVKSITVSNALSGRQGFYRYISKLPTGLSLPQGTASSFLGHDCGGIKETVSAGFDLTTGYPTGVVGMSTSCGGSGRDGGGHTTTYPGTADVTWDFAGNTIAASSPSTGTPATTNVDAYGDVIFTDGPFTYLFVPVPAAPMDVVAGQSGDQFNVSWAPNGANPLAITSSILTAIPINSSAPALTATVTGTATTGIISGVQPQTAYQVTVASTTIGGTGPASAPVDLTTVAATIPPSAPTGLKASWEIPDPSGSTDTIAASWQAATPGNSPVDEYLISITGSDGGGTFTQTDSGTTLTSYFNVDFTPNWSVTVQAHNAAGWGPVSTAVKLGGL